MPLTFPKSRKGPSPLQNQMLAHQWTPLHGKEGPYLLEIYLRIAVPTHPYRTWVFVRSNLEPHNQWLVFPLSEHVPLQPRPLPHQAGF